MSLDDPGSQSPTILDRLARGELLISDGATGTFLFSLGLEPGGCPEELNVSHPEMVQSVTRAYFEAGSDMVLTNSFGGSRFMLGKYGYGDRVLEFNRRAVQHARSQASPGHYVVGCVGPSGEFMEPLGEVSEAEMSDAFAEQITALAGAGADGVAIETMTALEEASVAITAAKKIGGLAVMATMAFDKGPRGFFTMMGVTPEQAVEGLQEAGADVVGANCGTGIESMVELGRRMREATDGYLIIHANAGIPSIKHGEIVYPETPDSMVDGFLELADMGINIISGCCGTGPEHVHALTKALRG